MPPCVSIYAALTQIDAFGTENAPTASEGLVNAYRQLTRREVDRILKLISASVAGPYVPNTMVRQMLGIRTRPIVVLAIYSDRFGAARSMEHL
jgi:hypothetical protein